jgi:hypothetical protein
MMQAKQRTPVERAAAAVERAIDRELPRLIPAERRALWVALVVAASKRLRDYDRSAEANGLKPVGDPVAHALAVAEDEGMPPAGL